MQENVSFVFGYTSSKNNYIKFDVAQLDDELVLIFRRHLDDINFMNLLAQKIGVSSVEKFKRFFIKKVALKNNSITLSGIIAKNYDVIKDEAGLYFVPGNDFEYMSVNYGDDDIKSLKINRDEFNGLVEEEIIECDFETLMHLGVEPRFKLLGKNGEIKKIYI